MSVLRSFVVTPPEASRSVVVDFLISLFGKGLLVSTIRDCRSAVVTTHAGFPDVSSVSSVPQFSLPLLSFYLERFSLLRLWFLFGVFLSS